MTDPNSVEPNVLLAQIAADLSASSVPPLTSPDKDHNLTLREAVQEVLEKTTEVLGLEERPTSPQAADDLFGHVLSLRAEHLATLAIVAALADHLGIDVQALITKSQTVYGK